MGEIGKEFQDSTSEVTLVYQQGMIAANARREMMLAAVRAKYRPLREALMAKQEVGDFTRTPEEQSQIREMEQANREIEMRYTKETSPIRAAYGRATEEARFRMQEENSRRAANVKVSPSELVERIKKQKK